MGRKKSFKTTIPWVLHIALIKLQGRLESTYEEACIRASQLLDSNSEEFEKAVASETSKIEKSQIMSKVNKNRKGWIEKGYKNGFSEGHKQGYRKGVTENQITYNCSVCNGEIVMKPGGARARANDLSLIIIYYSACTERFSNWIMSQIFKHIENFMKVDFS